MATIHTKIVQIAKNYVGSRKWMYGVEKGNFGKNTNKCNLFVYDVMAEAGVSPAPFIPKYVFLKRPPLAREWADPKTSIQGFDVVSNPQPGDVVAEAHEYADATGHVGIVIGENLTVSASSMVHGVIVQNDWGFRDDNHPTFRRYEKLVFRPPPDLYRGPKY